MNDDPKYEKLTLKEKLQLIRESDGEYIAPRYDDVFYDGVECLNHDDTDWWGFIEVLHFLVISYYSAGISKIPSETFKRIVNGD